MNSPASTIELLDDPQEWLAFGQPRPGTPEAPAAWESQVVVEGMHCAACAFNIEAALLAVPGVQSAEVNAASRRARVVWQPERVLPSQWMDAIGRAGYKALPAADGTQRDIRLRETRLALWRWLVATLCMMQVMMYAYPTYVTDPGDISPDMVQLLRWACWLLSVPVMLFSCTPFFSNAWRDLVHRRISMDLPVALGMLITFGVSSVATFEPQGVFGEDVYFDSLTMFVFFLLGGRLLELKLRDRTAGALDALLNRLPESVRRRRADGSVESVALRRLRVGDEIEVRPGEGFPADGTILSGRTLADEALLTGESRPQPRGVGEPVVAGSHNLLASVWVRVERVGEDTRYAQIVSLMAEAAVEKPRLALLADRVAKPFLWAVLGLAAAAALYGWATDPSRALMVAVAVLIVTCPCALSLATPAAMLAGAGRLARQGVLVRRLQALEALSQVDTVFFDKTGTLTRDGQRITQTWVAPGTDAAHALAAAAQLAQRSVHPLSRALVQAAAAQVAQTDQGLPPAWPQVEEISGQGLQGLDAQGRCWRLGSRAHVEQQGARVPAQAWSAQVHWSCAGEWIASWQFSEDIRDEAPAVVAALQAAGLSVHILSGDRPEAAQRVGQALGIDHVRGGCSPQDKLDALRAAQSQGHRVLMIGDGLNDGPVLARADVALTVGQAVPLAQSRADLVLMGHDLHTVTQAFVLSRETLRVVRQNLWWAGIYNLVCVPLAVFGWLPPWLAGLGMAASSLAVVANAWRLQRTAL